MGRQNNVVRLEGVADQSVIPCPAFSLILCCQSQHLKWSISPSCALILHQNFGHPPKPKTSITKTYLPELCTLAVTTFWVVAQHTIAQLNYCRQSPACNSYGALDLPGRKALPYQTWHPEQHRGLALEHFLKVSQSSPSPEKETCLTTQYSVPFLPQVSSKFS